MQPREEIGEAELAELAESIRRHGLLQPIVVRASGEGGYEIVAGERRWRAAKMAGLQRVPCVLVQCDDRTALAMAMVENLQRADLNPLEEARGYRRLMEQFGLTQEQVAEAVGRSRVAVANKLRLLQLPEAVQELLRAGKLTEGHARALLALEDSGQIEEAARRVVEEGLSVRQTEELVRNWGKRARPAKARSRQLPPVLKSIEEKLQQALATRVRLKPKRRGGVIEIEYFSEEELERIVDMIAGLG